MPKPLLQYFQASMGKCSWLFQVGWSNKEFAHLALKSHAHSIQLHKGAGTKLNQLKSLRPVKWSAFHLGNALVSSV